jgi:ABC-type transport system involved in multi-copper enzyme maturation permease subunit
MIPLFIYLLGFFITYIITKIYRNKENKNDWVDVRITLFLSSFSWTGLILIIMFIISSIKFPDKPPKWL